MLQLPPGVSQKIRVARGPVSLPTPVAAGDTVFAGYEESEVLRIDLPRTEPLWRLPAAGSAPDACFGEIVLLRGTSSYRGLRFSGESVWELKDGTGGATGWARFGGSLVSLNPGVFIADATTGTLTDHHEVSGPLIGGARLWGETLLLNAKDGGDPTRVYDVSARRIVWERNLTNELRALAVGRRPSDELFFPFCGSERLMVARFAASLFGVALDDGRILWHRHLSTGSNPPVIVNGRIFAWTWGRESSHEQHLVCLDEATGEVIYKTPLAKYGGDFAFYQDVLVGRPVGDYLAFGARSGLLAVFRLSDGELVWSYKYKAQVYWPVIEGHRLLVTSADGNLLVFGGQPTSSRDERQRSDNGGPRGGSPAMGV